MQPEEARARLMAYKAPKNSDLAKVEATIQALAARVASAMPAGPSRTQCYNSEVIQGLIRSLPLASSLIVTTQYNEKSAKFGRTLTAAELSRFLNIYRHTIDSDIRTNGVDNRSFERKNLPRAGNIGGRKFSAYYTGAPSLPPKPQAPQMVRYRSSGQINQVTQNYRPKPFVANQRPMIRDNQNMSSNFSNMRNNNWSNKFGTTKLPFGNSNGNNANRMTGFRGNKPKLNMAPRKPFVKNNGNQNFKRRYCSLCGQTSHVAADGCNNMVSDAGIKVPVLPTKETCNECPPHVNPRLSHPASICPYRKNGPWGKL